MSAHRARLKTWTATLVLASWGLGQADQLSAVVSSSRLKAVKASLIAFLQAPQLYDPYLSLRLQSLAGDLRGPKGTILPAGAPAPGPRLNLAVGDLWREPDGAHVAFMAGQRTSMQALADYLESRGQVRLSARWLGSFIFRTGTMMESYRNGGFSNRHYHHTPSMYSGAWFGQTYLGGESNLLHSNWGRPRSLPFTWDLDRLLTATAGRGPTHWQTADAVRTGRPWQARFELFTNLGWGLDITNSKNEVQASGPAVAGGAMAQAVVGARQQWNFHVSLYQKAAGGFAYAFAADSGLGRFHRPPLRQWTNAVLSAAWIPTAWIRVAGLYGAAKGYGARTLAQEQTLDGHISVGNSRHLKINLKTTYVLHSSHPARHRQLYYKLGLDLLLAHWN